MEKFPCTDTSAAVIIQADAWKTEWFTGKWEIFWRIHFIVFAIDGQPSETQDCKYMSHSGFMSQIYFLTEQLSWKCRWWEALTMPSTQADLSFCKSFLALCLVAWNHLKHRRVVSVISRIYDDVVLQIWCHLSNYFIPCIVSGFTNPSITSSFYISLRSNYFDWGNGLTFPLVSLQ